MAKTVISEVVEPEIEKLTKTKLELQKLSEIFRASKEEAMDWLGLGYHSYGESKKPIKDLISQIKSAQQTNLLPLEESEQIISELQKGLKLYSKIPKKPKKGSIFGFISFIYNLSNPQEISAEISLCELQVAMAKKVEDLIDTKRIEIASSIANDKDIIQQIKEMNDTASDIYEQEKLKKSKINDINELCENQLKLLNLLYKEIDSLKYSRNSKKSFISKYFRKKKKIENPEKLDKETLLSWHEGIKESVQEIQNKMKKLEQTKTLGSEPLENLLDTIELHLEHRAREISELTTHLTL